MASGRAYQKNDADEDDANRLQKNGDSSIGSQTASERLVWQQKGKPSRLASELSKTMTTTTTTVRTTTTTTEEKAAAAAKSMRENSDGPKTAKEFSVARVEDQGKQAAIDSNTQAIRENLANKQAHIQTSDKQQQYDGRSQVKPEEKLTEIDGNNRVTTISTIAAQSGQSRIVLAILKDGTDLQLKVQEMRPSIFEVGADYNGCLKFLAEHQKLVKNLRKQKETPIECWLAKYQRISSTSEPNMTAERKLVYMCMVENLQACWKALLKQLDQRTSLLKEVCEFYESAEQLAQALNKADKHVQVFRQEFFAGPGSLRFNQACKELELLNDLSLERYNHARRKQQELVDSISVIGTGNLGDARVNQHISSAQDLINYISNYLDPLDRQRIKLESFIDATEKTFYNSTKSSKQSDGRFVEDKSTGEQNGDNNSQVTKTSINFLRDINNFNDLSLADNWLNVKIEQLNSSLLSSLGLSVSDSRSILDKHDQIALECRAIEEASLTFDGKNIHAIKSLDPQHNKDNNRIRGDVSLFEQQKLLAQRTRNVITILEARIVLLRRTIDFYSRSKEATIDVNKMMRRLQVDNSLQSIQFVSNELELKDVSSVVASGATIINELQQLQLAQQHGQRSRIVNLNLVTSGIRSIIDQLSQDLAHLKTVLNQRRLVLLNEDATKMGNNFSNKCHQLQFWLNSHVKSFLWANNRIGIDDLDPLRVTCDKHEQLRVAVQNKTLEVEALLRSLPTLSENFDDPKSKVLEKIQQETDELRHNWIQATNCLDRRLDLIRKYLAILSAVKALNKEFESLESFASGRPTNPDRTDADIRTDIEQSSVQLANQVKNFNLDAQKLPTGLDQPTSLEGTVSTTDINKQQMVEHANELLRIINDRKQASRDASDTSRVSKRVEQPAHQRPQQVDPPRFTRTLNDQVAEPFSTIELECETDQADCRVDWFMNNFKKIPQNIRHSSSSEGNQHKLTIHNFSPVCCGTYMARAWNGSGQAVSQCKLRLAGIKELQDEPSNQVNPSASLWRQHETATQRNSVQTSSSPAISTTSSFSQWRPNETKPSNDSKTNQRTTRTTTTTPTTMSDNTTMSRIIQGVDSQQSESPNPMIKITQLANDSSDTGTKSIGDTRFPSGNQTTHSGQSPATSNRNSNANHCVGSPVSSTTLTRSMSKSPFGVSPQPSGFAKGPMDSSPRSCSRSSLVLVVGNPPPTIEWMHNNKTITTATCPRPGGSVNGSICKLTIETSNPRTQGQYVCGPQIK